MCVCVCVRGREREGGRKKEHREVGEEGKRKQDSKECEGLQSYNLLKIDLGSKTTTHTHIHAIHSWNCPQSLV